MGRRQTNKALGVMYADFDTETSLEQKLAWMKVRYKNKLGIEPQIAFVHTDSVNGTENLLGITLISIGKPLHPFLFVLCQEPKDYLVQKTTPFSERG